MFLLALLLQRDAKVYLVNLSDWLALQICGGGTMWGVYSQWGNPQGREEWREKSLRMDSDRDLASGYHMEVSGER